MKNKLYLIFSILFFLIISAPFWGMLISKNENSHENRTLAHIKNVKGIFSLNQFLVDNHAFRNDMSSISMRFYLKVLKESPIPQKVILGKDGWLFFQDEYDPFNANLGVNKITNQDITLEMSNINNMKHICDSIGVSLYIVIAPNKESIYPEYLPLKPNKTKRYLSYIKEESLSQGINFIDLKDVLLANKDKNILYCKYDSHWNTYGALLGTIMTLDIIGKNVGVDKISESDFIIEKELDNGENFDLSNILGLHLSDKSFSIKPKKWTDIHHEIIKEGQDYPLLEYFQNNNSYNNVKAFVISDSFFINMKVPFTSGVSKVSIFRVPSMAIYKEDILSEIDRVGKPDFILYEIVERNMSNISFR